MLPGKKYIGRPRVTGPAELAALRQLTSDGTGSGSAGPSPVPDVRRTGSAGTGPAAGT